MISACTAIDPANTAARAQAAIRAALEVSMRDI
jgi:hypothetical protein